VREGGEVCGFQGKLLQAKARNKIENAGDSPTPRTRKCSFGWQCSSVVLEEGQWDKRVRWTCGVAVKFLQKAQY